MRVLAFIISLGLAIPQAVSAQSCGGSFSGFVDRLRQEAISRGHAPDTVAQFFAPVRQDPAVIKADRRQGVFQMPFVDFARRLISAGRLQKGRQMAQSYDAVFDQIERTYGINRGVLLAFWAFETDYGAFQGDFNTLNSLVTLAHDCRRPHLFRPQVFAALELYKHGDFSPTNTTGAWAGEIGMVQMLPQDILDNGVDGDGDGHVSLKTSAPDALMSGAKMLSHLGWRPNEPWLQEVELPESLDWYDTGLHATKTVAEWEQLGVRGRSGPLDDGRLPASIIIPQGRKGP